MQSQNKTKKHTHIDAKRRLIYKKEMVVSEWFNHGNVNGYKANKEKKIESLLNRKIIANFILSIYSSITMISSR